MTSEQNKPSYRARGFKDAAHLKRHAAGVDRTTPEKEARFKRWEAWDGTKAGLDRLNELRRLSNWPTIFHQFLVARRAQAFEWGRNDCCLFACDCILAITGLDPAATMYRGKYRDALGAARLLKKQGGVEALAVKECRRFGFPECSVRLARRGDLVVLEMGESGPTLGICGGAKSAFVGQDGILWHPTLNCRRAWRIG